MVELSLSTLITPILGGITGALGAYVAISNQMAAFKVEMRELRKDVEKHNSVVERTYKLESDSRTSWSRYDELKERVHDLENEVHGAQEG